MDNEFRLKVFFSHSGKGQHVWEPLAKFIEKFYSCKIIWEQDEAPKYHNPEDMMEQMVQRSDVVIFLMTHAADGVFHEMKLWHKYNGGSFENALVLRDHSVSRDIVRNKTGFEVVDIGFKSHAPWSDIHYILPAIDLLLKRGSQNEKLPSWMRTQNKILDEYSWKVKNVNVPVNRTRTLFQRMAANPRYRDPEKWSFRINWHTGAPEVDSYSNEITSLDLFEALLQTNAAREEYELIFDALARAMHDNVEPPRKLAAAILFSGCLVSTLERLKDICGNHPYERIGFAPKRALYAEQVPDKPESLLLPKHILIQSDNCERFLDSQRLILNAVSKVCKYIQCSTVEVTASHSFVIDDSADSQTSKLLAMSCTATRTNKESLAAISEVPVIREVDERIVWHGQLHKKPTSEYQAHWLYHKKNQPDRVARNLVVHFHPVALLDAFAKVNEPGGIGIRESQFIQEVERFFEVRNIDFHTYGEYEEKSSRSDSFGLFMRDTLQDLSKEYSVIWKPNHGIWVFFDDRNCSDTKLVETFLALDGFSRDAARTCVSAS